MATWPSTRLLVRLERWRRDDGPGGLLARPREEGQRCYRPIGKALSGVMKRMNEMT